MSSISTGSARPSLAALWWVPLLRGVVAILFGLVALVMPGLTVAFLLGAFAAFAIIDGVMAIIQGFRRRESDSRWWAWLLEGVLSLGIGAVALLWPLPTAIALVFWIAAWAIVSGVLRIVAAISLRREIEGEWALGLSGALWVLLGVLMVAMPGAGLLSIAWMFGIFALLLGITLVIFAFRLRRLRQAG